MIKIFVLAFNRPDILQQQIDSFKKNLVGEYEFNIVYDTRDNKYLDEFKEICEKNKANFYHHVSEPGKDPSFYGSDNFRWAYENIILNDPDDFIALILDHDMFLIDELNVEEYMKDYDIATPVQTRQHIKYPWQGLFFFRKNILVPEKWNFYPTFVDGVMLDAGGGLHSLLEDENIRVKNLKVEYPDEYEGLDLKASDEGYGFELYDNQTFFHSRNACSWHNGYDITNKKVKTDIINLILKNING